MVRNIPNQYTRDLLFNELNQTGFQGSFDFLYLPIDPSTGSNKGYAFVNFLNKSWAKWFMEVYENRQMAEFGSVKRIQTTPAVLQGFDANYAHYAQTHVNQQRESWRPMFILDIDSAPRASSSCNPTTSLRNNSPACL